MPLMSGIKTKETSAELCYWDHRATINRRERRAASHESAILARANERRKNAPDSGEPTYTLRTPRFGNKTRRVRSR